MSASRTAAPRFIALVVFLLFLVALPGCDGSGPTAPAPPPQGAIAVSINPRSIVASMHLPLSAQWTVYVTETAQVAGELNSVEARIRDNGTEVGVITLSSSDLVELLGSRNVAGGSRVEIPMSMVLDVPLGCRSLSMTVQAQFTDVSSNTATGTASAPVEIRVPRLLAPAAGATLDNGCRNQSDIKEWVFEWGACEGADAYHLFVKNSGASIPVIDSSMIMEPQFNDSRPGYVLDSNRLGWFWRVRARWGNEWTDWTPERRFNVEPLDTDCPAR